MSFLPKWLRLSDPRDAQRPLYSALIDAARQPHWYQAGGVPDTLDGRFDMLSLMMSLTLRRLQGQDDNAAVMLTELFVDDMDAQVRQIGFGDMVVGKQIGRMVGALGGRLGAYDAADNASFRSAIARNMWRGATPDAAALDHVVRHARAWELALAATPVHDLVRGIIAPVQP